MIGVRCVGHGDDLDRPATTAMVRVRALMIDRHPQWRLPEWIERGVGCLCAEHPQQAAGQVS